MPVGWWVRLDAVASCQLGLCLPFSPGSRLIRVLGGGGGLYMLELISASS